MTELMKNKVAVITGAGSGIGRSAALKLAEHGANIAILDVSKQKASQVQEEIKQLGRESFIIQTDVSESGQVQYAFAEAFNHFGQIDFVFANAGINGVIAPVEDIAPEE